MINYYKIALIKCCLTISLFLSLITGSWAQVINTIAGDSTQGYNGDGIAATAAELFYPKGVVVDANYNIFIGDMVNNRVRKISGGIINTVAGNGTTGYSGDGGPATNAQLDYPAGVTLDDSGNLYIADYLNSVIRKVNAKTQIITTIAGNGTAGYSGDGGQATDAQLFTPLNVAVDTAGNVYIADTHNYCIRKIAVGTGIITTFAGTHIYGYTGDGGLASNAEMTNTMGVIVDDSDNVYITDIFNERVRKVNGSTGIITTIAGNGVAGYTGDGGQATAAELSGPIMMALDRPGNLYIADYGNNVDREVNKSTGIITTVVGDGTAGFSGDGGPATDAEFNGTWCIAFDTSGNLYAVDENNNRVREVVPAVTVVPGPVSICNGTGVTLKASGGVSYTWSPSAGLNTTTGDSVIATPTITTTYVVTGKLGSATATDTDVVTVLQPPNRPTITISTTGDSLISSSQSYNQWYFNGQPLDSTRQVLVIKGRAKGWYTVTVTNEANGCSTTSDSTTSVNQLSVISEQLSVYPNPTNGSVFVKISSVALNVNDWSLQLTDVLGRSLYTMPSLNYSNEIDLSDLASGVYFILVVNKTSRVVMPVVKQ